MESPRAEFYASSDTGRTRMIDAEARYTDLDENLNEVGKAAHEQYNFSQQEMQEPEFLNDLQYYVCEEQILDNAKIRFSDCISIMSAVAEKLVEVTHSVCRQDDCRFDKENLPTIYEQYITADLTGLMTISCSHCGLDNAKYEKCQGELALQCLTCREKFFHRFWAIRHINSCASIIKQPKYMCELCETTFERIDELRRHLQDCASDCFTSLQLENNTHSEEALDMLNYFANSSEILRKSVREYGHERFYAHFCVECRESIIDETSVDAVDCDECKVSCLLQCNTCKCLHETYESIIEHLKGSYCGYKMQLAVDSDAQLHEQQTSKLGTLQRQDGSQKRTQKKKLDKRSNQKKTTMRPLVKVCCRSCVIFKMTYRNSPIQCESCRADLVYVCGKCDLDLPTLKALKHHEKLHFVDDACACAQCGKEFARVKNYKMHKDDCKQSRPSGDVSMPKESDAGYHTDIVHNQGSRLNTYVEP
ncbi:zinc finger protein 12-like [Nasonia vitripennis]|uniref:C2H2-type domain-containing protein n=1 Tax=Nasonia vitripennis TaxID=7425 RepID=A0A7M7QFU3_NASVI|nr:zinc finger protein 12-like [Nasonia vitripennis]